jgi:hypothetical protein
MVLTVVVQSLWHVVLMNTISKESELFTDERDCALLVSLISKFMLTGEVGAHPMFI